MSEGVFMQRKSLILVIVLLLVGLVVVSAQTQADADAMLKLTEDFMAGRITMPEFERRMAEITNRMEQQTPQVPQQQQQPRQQQQRGENTGWPPASVFQPYYGNIQLRQPVGTTARYDSEYDFVIYLTGGNTNTVTQDLKRQIETIIGKQMSNIGADNDPTYSAIINNPNRRTQGTEFYLSQEGGVVRLRIAGLTQ